MLAIGFIIPYQEPYWGNKKKNPPTLFNLGRAKMKAEEACDQIT